MFSASVPYISRTKARKYRYNFANQQANALFFRIFRCFAGTNEVEDTKNFDSSPAPKSRGSASSAVRGDTYHTRAAHATLIGYTSRTHEVIRNFC